MRRRYGVLSGTVGIFLNLILFAGKLSAGLLVRSVAVTADAFNNLSDAASSVITLIGFKLAGKRADRDHPFGHGRIEYLAGLMISMLGLIQVLISPHFDRWTKNFSLRLSALWLPLPFRISPDSLCLRILT